MTTDDKRYIEDRWQEVDSLLEKLEVELEQHESSSPIVTLFEQLKDRLIRLNAATDL